MNSPYQIGYLSGMIGLLILTLGLYVFVVFAIVRAATRRTTGWIIVGACGVLFIVASWIALGMVAYQGFKQSFNRALASQGLPTDLSTSSGPTTHRGKAVPYTIDLPAHWTKEAGAEDFEFLAYQGRLHVGVTAQAESLENPEFVADMARQRLGTKAAEVVLGEPASEQIDGHRWLRFTAQSQIDGEMIKSQFHVYSGEEGTFKIVGWTLPSRFDQDAGRLQAIAQSFRFPLRSAGADAPRSAAQAKDQTLTGDRAPYHLTVPADWKVKRPSTSLDLVASSPLVSVAVVVEKTPGTPESALHNVQFGMQKVTQAPVFGPPTRTTIDGREWLEFEVHCQVEETTLAYDCFVHGDEEGEVRIMGWTVENLYPQKLPIIREAARSFRFPANASTVEPAAPAVGASGDPSPPSDASSPVPKPTPSRAPKSHSARERR